MIRREWQLRVNSATDEALRILHWPPEAKRQAKAFVGILYDIHLLGDLKPGNVLIDSIQDVIKIQDDIIKNSQRLFGKRHPIVLQLEQKLRQIPKTVRSNPQEYANRILKVLSDTPVGNKMKNVYLRNETKSVIANTKSSQQLLSSQSEIVAGALKGAAIVALFSGLSNSWKVVNGEQNCATALRNVTKDALVAGASIYVSEAIIQNIGGGKYAITALSNSGNSLTTQAMGAGLNIGLATFVFDQTSNIYDLYSGNIALSKFVETTKDSVLKAGATSAAAYCTVILGAAPGGFIVMGVSVGTYLAVNYALNVFKRYRSSFYLTENDLLLVVSESVLKRKTVLDILPKMDSQDTVLCFDNAKGNSIFNDVYTKDGESRSAFDDFYGNKNKGESNVLEIFK